MIRRGDIIRVRGRWTYLYRAIDSNRDTVEFYFSERHNLAAAKRFLARALKRHVRPMLAFQTVDTARITLSGIKTIHIMRKQQAKYARNPPPSLAVQFNTLAA
jgi:transposase-like protein